jgi:phosphoglycerate dehydrogenase-like enzyme
VSVIEVLVCVPDGDALTSRLQAVDARVRVRQAPDELRRWLSGAPDGDAAWRVRVEQQAADYLDRAEVLVGAARLPREALDRAVRLRWVQVMGAGVENLTLDDYRRLTLTNASGAAAVPMAEYAISLMLLFAKGFPHLIRRQLAGEWDSQARPFEIAGATCGIIGLGAVGREVARLSRALGMHVVATRRSITAPTADALGCAVLPSAELPALLERSDYVVVTVPLTTETRGLVGARELAMMKPAAVLINLARGPVIDERALIVALQAGEIAGAGLDVFEREPLPADSPLWNMANVVITPHYSYDSPQYHERRLDLFCDNLRRYLAGAPLRNVVDVDHGY